MVKAPATEPARRGGPGPSLFGKWIEKKPEPVLQDWSSRGGGVLLHCDVWTQSIGESLPTAGDGASRERVRGDPRLVVVAAALGTMLQELGTPTSLCWEVVGPAEGDAGLPTHRSKHACTTWKGLLYVHGGRDARHSLADLWQYEPGKNMWQRLDERTQAFAAPALHEHTMVAAQGHLYLFGGLLCDTDHTPLWDYNINECCWEEFRGTDLKAQAAPQNRRDHTAVVHRAGMYVYGGHRDMMGPTNEFWELDLESRVWRCRSTEEAKGNGGSPGQRCAHSATCWRDRMFVYGGLERLRVLDDFWAWDFTAEYWMRLTARSDPGQLHHHAMCMIGGCDGGALFLFGGKSNSRVMGDAWLYRFKEGAWRKVRTTPNEELPPNMAQHALVSFFDRDPNGNGSSWNISTTSYECRAFDPDSVWEHEWLDLAGAFSFVDMAECGGQHVKKSTNGLPSNGRAKSVSYGFFYYPPEWDSSKINDGERMTHRGAKHSTARQNMLRTLSTSEEDGKSVHCSGISLSNEKQLKTPKTVGENLSLRDGKGVGTLAYGSEIGDLTGGTVRKMEMLLIGGIHDTGTGSISAKPIFMGRFKIC
ncbi:uncharacterized protein LOC116938699 isoform X1 [Petromyzon marinus]|uniref:uncharacterized protein LOC116938699 isoform X1 n=1 Tax=Petromyzon marinus TaxID=7757 RepID=UPI003F70CA9C